MKTICLICVPFQSRIKIKNKPPPFEIASFFSDTAKKNKKQKAPIIKLIK